MLTKHHRYIKYEPIKAKLYARSPSLTYLSTACFCVVFMDADKNSFLSVYSRSEPIHFKTRDIDNTKEHPQPDKEHTAVEFEYNDQRYGIVVKPYLVEQLREMMRNLAEVSSIPSLHDDTRNEATLKEIFYDVNLKSNAFVKNKVESDTFDFYDTRLAISNTLQLCILKNGRNLELWMCQNNAIKLIHSFTVEFQGEVSRVLAIPNTEYVCVSFKDKPLLWFYNIDTSKVTEMNLQEEFKVEDGVVDFILAREIYRQEMVLITQKSIFMINLTKFFEGEKKQVEILIPKEFPERYILLRNHSLSAYAVVLQNTKKKGSYQLKLVKGFGTNNVFLTIPISKRIVDLDFSGKTLACCYEDGSIEFAMISSLDKEASLKQPSKLKLKEKDIQKYKLWEERFRCVKISYNRTFVVAAIKNLLVMWRVNEIVENRLEYEVSVFPSRVMHMENWRENRELLWVVLEDRNLELLLNQ